MWEKNYNDIMICHCGLRLWIILGTVLGGKKLGVGFQFLIIIKKKLSPMDSLALTHILICLAYKLCGAVGYHIQFKI